MVTGLYSAESAKILQNMQRIWENLGVVRVRQGLWVFYIDQTRIAPQYCNDIENYTLLIPNGSKARRKVCIVENFYIIAQNELV